MCDNASAGVSGEGSVTSVHVLSASGDCHS